MFVDNRTLHETTRVRLYSCVPDQFDTRVAPPVATPAGTVLVCSVGSLLACCHGQELANAMGVALAVGIIMSPPPVVGANVHMYDIGDFSFRHGHRCVGVRELHDHGRVFDPEHGDFHRVESALWVHITSILDHSQHPRPRADVHRPRCVPWMQLACVQRQRWGSSDAKQARAHRRTSVCRMHLHHVCDIPRNS